MNRTLILERRVVSGSLLTIQAIHAIFARHRLEWTAWNVGRYSEEMVQEFYATYVVTLRSQMDTRCNPTKNTAL